MEFNFLAIGIAIVADMMLGALWYSPLLFGKVWMKAVGIEKPEDLGDTAKPAYAASGVCAVAMALFLSWLLGRLNIQTIGEALPVVLVLWLGVIAPVVAVPYFWEDRPKVPFGIYSGYKLVAICITAVILTTL